MISIKNTKLSIILLYFIIRQTLNQQNLHILYIRLKKRDKA